METLWNEFLSGLKWVGELLAHSLGLIVGAALIAIFTLLARNWIEKRKYTLSRKFERDEILRYLDALIVRSSALPFGDPTRTSMDAAAVASIITLKQVWTPLRATDYSPIPAGEAPSAPRERLLTGGEEELVTDRLARLNGKRVLILGDPGHGKSTLVSHYAIDLAERAIERIRHSQLDQLPMLGIPIRVFLRDIITSKSPTFNDFWSGVPEVAGNDELRRKLEDVVRDGNAVVLMDGLDEIRESELQHVKEVISYVSEACKGSLLVVTCRTYDYSKDSPNRKLPVDALLRLVPYRFPDMSVYVKNWYDAVIRAGRLNADAGEKLRAKLISSLELNKELRTLGETPLLMTLLTLVHTEEGELPDSRAIVYHRAVRYLLAETAQWRSQVGGATVASAEMMDLAQQVAHSAHCEFEQAGSAFRGLTQEQLAQIVRAHFRLDDHPPGPVYDEVTAKVSAHLLRLIQSHGLLLDQGGNRFAFAHRSLQEFLAGQYFSQGSHHPEALEVAQRSLWREAFRLMAGYGAREGGSLFYLLHLIDDLVATSRPTELGQPSVTDPILAGEMLIEIGKKTLISNGYRRVIELSTSSAGEFGLWNRVASSVADLIEELPHRIRAAERVRAANVASGLGDLRFQAPTGQLREIRDRLISLPHITSAIGTPPGEGREDERPQRAFTFPTFCVGKYLVTNMEFAEFVNNAGYKVMKWWETDEALRWISGDEHLVREIQNLWVETVTEYHAKEIRDREIDLNDIQREANLRCAPRNEPFYWRNRRFNRPNQPVVGINWWEARAYCAWLTDKSHRLGWLPADELLRLPTEFEWERAARDVNDGRAFPWGNEWDHDKAHTREDSLELNEPTPVGCYAAGTWPGGPLDLSGNVWEWLENLKLPYDKVYDSSRLSLGSLQDRAIRGSSWYNAPTFARCSSRFVDRPYNLYYDVGFRIVQVKNLPL